MAGKKRSKSPVHIEFKPFHLHVSVTLHRQCRHYTFPVLYYVIAVMSAGISVDMRGVVGCKARHVVLSVDDVRG